MELDEAAFRRYLATGLTSREIADAIKSDTGEETTADAVRQRAVSLGLSNRYYDPQSVIPVEWRPIRKAHRGNWTLLRLRQIDARRRGERLHDDPKKAELISKQLDGWIADLREQDAVIRYNPDDKKGFYRYRRHPGDGEFTSTLPVLLEDHQRIA